MSAEAAGFKRTVQTGVTVQVAQTERVDFSLQVGVATESVTVTAEAPLLKTENAEQSMNVTGEKVNKLPLNFGGGGAAGGGIRNWLSFIILAPGVSGTGYNSPVNGIPTGSYGNFKVYLEGQDSTSVNDASWTSSVAAASVETINEFSVQSSNFSAEFGQVAGDSTTSPPRAAPTSFTAASTNIGRTKFWTHAAPSATRWTATARTTTASPSAGRSGFPRFTTAATRPSSFSTWSASATISARTPRSARCPPPLTATAISARP